MFQPAWLAGRRILTRPVGGPDRFPSLLQVKSKTRLNARILKLNFLSDLANGAEVPWSFNCADDRDLKILSVV